MSLLTNFQDLATAVKLALDRKADKSKVNSDISRVENSISSVSTELSGVQSGLSTVSSPAIFRCKLKMYSSDNATVTLLDGFKTKDIIDAVNSNREVFVLVVDSPEYYQYENCMFTLSEITDPQIEGTPDIRFCYTRKQGVSSERWLNINIIQFGSTVEPDGVSFGQFYQINISRDYNSLYNAPSQLDISLNTAARHEHTNKAVIDKFSEVSGSPAYDGNSLVPSNKTVLDKFSEVNGSLKYNGNDIALGDSDILVVTRTSLGGTNKTPREIYDAWTSGKYVCVNVSNIDVSNRFDNILVPIQEANYNDFASFENTAYTFKGCAVIHLDSGSNAKIIEFDYNITTLGAWTVKTQNIKGLNTIDLELHPRNLADGTTITDGKAIKYSDGTLNTSSLSYTDYVPVGGLSEIVYPRILSTSTSSTFVIGMAFYSENYGYVSGQSALKNQPQFGYSMTRISVPGNAQYARFTWSSSLPSIMVYDASQYDNTVFNRLENLEARKQIYPLGLHTMPENDGVLNVIKRCRQMTDIKWTPAVDLPRLLMVQRSYPIPDTANAEEYEGVFKAGVEYKGIPYGRANDISSYGYDYGFVGKYINFDTFVSAVSNAGSIVSKESDFNLSDHESTVYAAVCSALTCYALDVSYYPTSQIPNIPGLTTIGKINNNGTRLEPSNFHLGDILNITSYHTAIITDIIKDSNGDVKIIELSDGSTAGLADRNYNDGDLGGVCRRRGWTIEQIYTSWGEYTLMRYSYISSVTYTPSPYVNVGDEPDMFRVIHYPCMPYMGEGFTYKSGYIPNTDIVIAPNLGYSYLRVFKDGTEMASSPFDVTESTDKISVGFSETGDYEAYLCNMSSGDDTAVSYKCHWSVE